MDLATELKWIHKELDNVNDPFLIEAFKNILKFNQKTSLSDRINIEQYNKEIDEAITEIENGKYHTQEEARKIANRW